MAGTSLKVAMIGAFSSLLAATINSIACFILVPLIYKLLAQLGFSRTRFNN